MIGPLSFTDDQLEPISMPGSSPEVALRRLVIDPDGGSHIAVRFPAGFRRPGTGRYGVAEEFLVIEGGLTMSGQIYGENAYGFVPPGHVRFDTHSSRGALALAWFGGPPRWEPLETVPDGPPAKVVEWPALSPRRGPLGPGRHLGSASGAEVWVLDEADSRVVVPSGAVVASIPERLLVVLDQNETLPPMACPLLVRLGLGEGGGGGREQA